MADAIREEIGVQPELVEGAGGVFDVTVDGKLIYSKHATGRFPDHAEILSKLRSPAS